MRNFALMAAALAAVLFVVGCQSGGETTPPEGSNSTVVKSDGAEGSKPAGNKDDATEKDSNNGKAADSSGVMYAANFEQAVADAEKDDKYVLIKFTADWCGPCHVMSDDMKKTDLSKEFAKVIPIEVDIDKEKDGAAVKNHYKDPNQPIPYIVLIDKTGKEVATETGQMPMPDFKAWLAKHAKA